MTRRLVVLPEAEDELSAAVEWYESRRTGLGVELMTEVDEAFTIRDDSRSRELQLACLMHLPRKCDSPNYRDSCRASLRAGIATAGGVQHRQKPAMS